MTVALSAIVPGIEASFDPRLTHVLAFSDHIFHFELGRLQVEDRSNELLPTQ